MGHEAELELLLSFDGVSYEAANGYVVEFTVKRTAKTTARPHGISYALVFRPVRGEGHSVLFRHGDGHGRFSKTRPPINR